MFSNEALFIHGIDVTLYERTLTGTDPFNAPIYEESAVTVPNVIVAPATEQEILDTQTLTGRRAVYTLGIPKSDTHNWTDVRVSFAFADGIVQECKTIGSPIQGIDGMIPLEWNRKVRCELYNNRADH